ncbi:MAG: LysM peptidoglycan-binding domain-containing protein [Anaerolineae bacterium]|nr:LysM peptidoglycan-binding domain-containing protein [Anaerolineae bacterium]
MRRLLLLLPSLFLILLVARPAAADGPIVYVVQPGDTLSGIAERYQTTPDAIARLNNLEDRDILQPGQKLAMLASGPGEIGAADSDAAPVGPRRDAQPQPVHLVVAGETLGSIAAQYDHNGH